LFSEGAALSVYQKEGLNVNTGEKEKSLPAHKGGKRKNKKRTLKKTSSSGGKKTTEDVPVDATAWSKGIFFIVGILMGGGRFCGEGGYVLAGERVCQVAMERPLHVITPLGKKEGNGQWGLNP